MGKKTIIILAVIVSLIILGYVIVDHRMSSLSQTPEPSRTAKDLSQVNSILDANYLKWKALGATHYSFFLRISCFCSFLEYMPLYIEVENEKVIFIFDNARDPVSFTNPNGTPNEYSFFADLFTIDGLFNYAKNALQNADEVNIEYDRNTGFPVFIGVDNEVNAVDDEIGIRISYFGVLPASTTTRLPTMTPTIIPVSPLAQSLAQTLLDLGYEQDQSAAEYCKFKCDAYFGVGLVSFGLVYPSGRFSLIIVVPNDYSSVQSSAMNQLFANYPVAIQNLVKIAMQLTPTGESNSYDLDGYSLSISESPSGKNTEYKIDITPTK